MEPALNLMVMTKENTAAKAFADHLLSLQLPDTVYARAGRIVGFMETKKGASHQTALDIAQAKRKDVLGEKKLLIGCGGGFQQESQQRYSPVKAWLMTLARTAGNCLVLWCGDHRQTPQKLRNTTDAKMFRRKLLARPLGLRCDTEYVQPHLLGLVVAKFMNGAVGSTAEKWASYLRGTAAVETLGAEVSKYLDAVPEDQKAPYAAALAVHYLARGQEELLTPLAVTLNEAAGTEGVHRWSLILPSSARVSLLTYQTVIGVRYQELVKYQDGEGRLPADPVGCPQVRYLCGTGHRHGSGSPQRALSIHQ